MARLPFETIISIFAVQSTVFGSWFPWSLPIRAVLDGAAGQDRISAVAVVGAIAAATIGLLEVYQAGNRMKCCALEVLGAAM